MSYLILQFAARGLGGAALLLLGASADPARVGQFIRILLAASIIQLFMDFGRSTATQRTLSEGARPARVFDMNRRYLWSCFGVVACAAIFGLLSVQRGIYFAAATAVALASLQSVTVLSQCTLLGIGERTRAGLLSGISPLVFLAGLMWILIPARDAALASLVMIQLLGAGGAALASVLVLRPFLGHDPVRRSRDPSALNQRPTGTLNVLSFLYYRADLLIVAALLRPADLAAYTLAYKFIEAASTLLQIAQVARLRSHVRAMQARRHKHFQTTLWLMVILALLSAAAVTAGTMGVGKLLPVGGPAIREALALVPLLTPLLIAVGLSQAAAVAIYGSLGERRNRRLVLVSVMNALFALGGNAIAIYSLGVEGVAAVQPLIEQASALLLLVALNRWLAMAIPPIFMLGSTITVVLLIVLALEPIVQSFVLWSAAVAAVVALPALTGVSRRRVLAEW